MLVNMPSSSGSQPSPPPHSLPRLPWDVLLQIIKASDTPTLASLARVSYELLEATSPSLYREVEVKSLELLECLFGEREGEDASNPSRINRLLSLNQIKTLTINFSTLLPNPQSSAPTSLSISTSRILGFPPLPLDNLNISIHYQNQPLLQSLLSSFLPHLNPTRCSYTISGRPRSSRDASPHLFLEHDDADSPQLHPFLSSWSRLETLEFDGSLLFASENSGGMTRLARLPKPTRDVRRVLRLHLSSLLSSVSPDPLAFLHALEIHQMRLGLGGMQRGSIVLVVRTEKQREEAERAVQQLMRWRGLFSVELEE